MNGGWVKVGADVAAALLLICPRPLCVYCSSFHKAVLSERLPFPWICQALGDLCHIKSGIYPSLSPTIPLRIMVESVIHSVGTNPPQLIILWCNHKYQDNLKRVGWVVYWAGLTEVWDISFFSQIDLTKRREEKIQQGHWFIIHSNPTYAVNDSTSNIVVFLEKWESSQTTLHLIHRSTVLKTKLYWCYLLKMQHNSQAFPQNQRLRLSY